MATFPEGEDGFAGLPPTGPPTCPYPPWAILLAGGEGRRLSPLVGRLHPDLRPKQFAAIIGTRTMVQHTYQRALAHAPPDRILAVITEGQQRWAKAQLPRLSPENLLVQPRNLDTGPAICLALMHVLAREPWARVLILPTDHFVFPEAGIVRPIADVLRALEALGGQKTVLLGAVPTGPRTSMGWIEPEGRGPALRPVRRFVEKPPPEEARRLYEGGALWNTFIVAGSARHLRQLLRRQAPCSCAGMTAYLGLRARGRAGADLAEDFAQIEPFNFSTRVLQREPGALVVAELRGVVWDDWGTPEGVCQSLTAMGWKEKMREEARGEPALPRSGSAPGR